MASASERWTPRRFTKGKDGSWSAIREFDIIAAANDAAAFSSPLDSSDLGTTTGLVPVFNEDHPANSFLRVDNLELFLVGFGLYRLVVSYSTPTGGSSHEDNDDPLSQPMRIRWRRQIQVEQFDQDADGNPIVNSARDAFTNPQSRDITQRVIEITRYEPFYDVAKAEIYENTANQGVWTIAGFITVPEGTAKLNTYQPTDDYTLTDEYVKVIYEIELRPDGFRSRHLDEGPRANATNAERVKCYTVAGEELDRVLLDGQGVPLDTGIRLGKGDLQREQLANPTGAIVESTANAVFLRYKRYKLLNFTGLGLV